MKKIPTLFERVFEKGKITGINPVITHGCEDAFLNGDATVKVDGSCCAVIDGRFYKRYDAKNGKNPPAGAIPCCDPDPVTGHWPHWVQVDHSNPNDKWFSKAKDCTEYRQDAGMEDGTYEAIGKHFNGNPYSLPDDFLVRHGSIHVNVERTFEGVKRYLENTNIEGIVFWLNGKPVCKIKRRDFGFPWPVKVETDGKG